MAPEAYQTRRAGWRILSRRSSNSARPGPKSSMSCRVVGRGLKWRVAHRACLGEASPSGRPGVPEPINFSSTSGWLRDLNNGEIETADVVVVGVGVTPASSWPPRPA